MNYQDLTRTYQLGTLKQGLSNSIMKVQGVRNRITPSLDDARQYSLFSMQEVLFAFGLTVHAIVGDGLRSRSRMAEEVNDSLDNFATFEGVTQEKQKTYMESVRRWSILTLFHFRMDTLFQSILRSMKHEPGRSGFMPNCKALLSKITLTNASHATAILEAITLTRNTLHNNGIHRGKNWGPLMVSGLTFQFKENKSVQCMSFGHILAILDATVDARPARINRQSRQTCALMHLRISLLFSCRPPLR